MSANYPDVLLSIRKIIYEKFNDVDSKFTNDDILSSLKELNLISSSTTADDMEKHFKILANTKLFRIIAQNFTTMWFKLFTPLIESSCDSCNSIIHVHSTEKLPCPNTSCKSNL
ncbi:MAG: hypothetical protein R1F52_05055 [Candidatus Nitrosoabyssus spongiisocia]|nr:MAG: hypothetical protein R1F52_05055 [Nitrosopumilaceae archaeon AB1(1)]